MCVCACMQGGIYVVELIDKFTLAFPLLIVVLLEVLVISYIYGSSCISVVVLNSMYSTAAIISSTLLSQLNKIRLKCPSVNKKFLRFK